MVFLNGLAETYKIWFNNLAMLKLEGLCFCQTGFCDALAMLAMSAMLWSFCQSLILKQNKWRERTLWAASWRRSIKLADDSFQVVWADGKQQISSFLMRRLNAFKMWMFAIKPLKEDI